MVHKGEAGGGWLRTAIARPVTVSVGVILTVLFGWLSVADLPIQLTPDIMVPRVSVNTRWPGAAPTEIEMEIIEEQEDALKAVPGLVEMTSTARADSSEVVLEFEVGTPLDETLVRVNNRLSQVPSYPEGADRPVIDTADTSGPPLAVITMRALEGSGADVKAYRTWVEQEILPQLERVPGVAGVRHIGGRDKRVHVDFDPVALAARRLTLPHVASRVGSELRNRSAGDVTMGKRSFLVRTPLSPDTPSLLERVVLGADDQGEAIVLGDVARVREGLREPTGVAMHDEEPSMVLLLTREAGTNVLEVTERMRALVEELNRTRFAPEGLEIEVVSDQTGYIHRALDLVQQNLILGACFAVLVLLLFLRSFGASAVISIAIPVSIFGTALGMTILGRTINVVSLAGITFAIGMVLDNSIVSLESIDTWRHRVRDIREAAFQGVQEIWGAVFASTLTTAAVFIPIITWEGEVGELLRDVAIAIAFAVGVSLIVSVLVIPSFAARILRTRESHEKKDRMARWGQRFRAAIGRQIRWLTRSGLRAGSVVVVAVAAALAVAFALLPPLEYLPTGNRNLLFGILVPPPGYAVEELEDIGRQIQHAKMKHTGVEKDGVPAIARSFFVGSPDRIFSGLIAEDPERVEGLLPFLRETHSKIPGMFAFTTQASLFGSGLGGGREIELQLSGSDLEALSRVGGEMMGRLNELLPGAQIRPIPSLDSGAPELHALPRREEAAGLRMNADQVATAVDALVDGTFIGEYGREGEPKIDVVLRADRPGVGEIDDPLLLASSPVATPSGDIVPLESLSKIEERLGPTVIQHIERRRAITLQIAPAKEVALEDAMRRVRDDVIEPMQRQGSLPAGVRVNISGTAGKLDVAKARFGEVLLMALLISFLLMAALFEDFLAPVAVLVSVPLAAAGGVLGLRLVDRLLGAQTLDLMTALGFLILIGVVVNNAILVVDGSIARLREGATLADAVPDAVEARVRPIFMTATTSIAGLLPMVVFPGAGSELYRGVGAIVLGGLALATVLTLYVVPSLFTLLWKGRHTAADAVRDDG